MARISQLAWDPYRVCAVDYIGWGWVVKKSGWDLCAFEILGFVVVMPDALTWLARVA